MNIPSRVQYCLVCGTSLIQMEKFGQERPVCPGCGWIYFRDPKVAVAVVVMKEEQVLLVERINPPFQGSWSLPAGFMDGGEIPEHAAHRECLEETGLDVSIGELLEVITGREHDQGADLVLVYRAEITSGIMHAGDDAASADFFELDDLPVLAFDTTRKTLEKIRKEFERNIK